MSNFENGDRVKVASRTPDDDIRPILGQTVTVDHLLSEAEVGASPEDVGPMYAVRDANGMTYHVFEDEITKEQAA